MRAFVLCVAAACLAGCPAPPHPTHPTQVFCPYLVDNLYQAQIDTSTPGTTSDPNQNPCFSGAALLQSWSAVDTAGFGICMASTTTTEQAKAACMAELDAHGITVGASAPGVWPPTFDPPGGRICTGTAIVLNARVLRRDLDPTMTPEGCREDTTLPLR